jgi:hypothetical protein
MSRYPEQIALFIVRAAVDRKGGWHRFRITSSTDIEAQPPEMRMVQAERIADELHRWIEAVSAADPQQHPTGPSSS